MTRQIEEDEKKKDQTVYRMEAIKIKTRQCIEERRLKRSDQAEYRAEEMENDQAKYRIEEIENDQENIELRRWKMTRKVSS